MSTAAFHPEIDPAMKFPSTPEGVPPLDADGAPGNPLNLMRQWISYVLDIGAVEPLYVTLATASKDGAPSSRTVHLLDVEDDAVRFTTNFGSRKGVEMTETGRAAVSLYWRETAQSINFTGDVVVASDEESDARFAEEHRKTQASRVVSFHGLDLRDPQAQVREFEELVAAPEPIARPDYWKYFRIVPDAVTFWEGHPESLNRRIHYTRTDGTWRHGWIQA
ncbi:pyridoxamine 5'-phosphate oxidase family protein [Nocardioides sp. zg-536]|uniref:Pyridoxamine 5'-phosphate oxidase family protein n=1 Tax=Nocardioides faecalis TaxID=2803858 RepID=A0A939BYJ3_9ACTN|nr:pyridoxamine 5'-phosphate oxidase family protein [Nocardioides faecalis]MBM9460000.1 pyridoxamine 5'-phosphate oxidase family protein [Nocardioides faecalis]MBS4753132.1 pyridoxamine 5'-phosphate oxidase family protein [Nocardioides faecalis]QVI58779.1 pyridoxamine 5'-phosphate oxidase family protein [Nocardioides faecalis]